MSSALRDRNAYYLIDARKSKKRKKDTAGEEMTRPWNGNSTARFTVSRMSVCIAAFCKRVK